MNMFLKASSLRRIEAKFYDCWREQPVLDSWLCVCLQGKVKAAMDSKLVSRELWKLVRPVLKDAS